MTPYFSIIIPTYNRANLINALLQGFINQTYKNFEIIIVDDGSVDNTEFVVNSYHESRFKYFKKPNGGVSSARNFGLKKAKGNYINFFDSDDLVYANHLQEAFKFFSLNKDAEIIIFDYDWGNRIQTKYKTISNRYKYPNNAIKKKNYISTNCIFFLANIANKIKFNEVLTISEDWECWIKLSLKTKFYLVNTVTSYIVEHKNRSMNNIEINYLINQKTNFIESLKAEINTKLEKNFNIDYIEAHFCSLIALQAAINRNKKISINYFIQSIKLSIFTFFTKRALAIIKHLIIKW